MRFPTGGFEIFNTQVEWPYVDVEFTDRSMKCMRRCWRITFDADAKAWHGALLRAEDDEAGFEFDVRLPRKVVNALAPLCAYSVFQLIQQHEVKHED